MPTSGRALTNMSISATLHCLTGCAIGEILGMAIVDNLVVVVIPGAMEAGLGSLLFWGALSFALSIAFVVAVPVNRWLIARGKGHAAVHRTGVHGGPNPRLVGVILAIAFVFGTAVLIAE